MTYIVIFADLNKAKALHLASQANEGLFSTSVL